jgi:hypothetical protein
MLTVSDAFGRNRILAGLPTRERLCVEQFTAVTQAHLGDGIGRPWLASLADASI